MTTRGSSGKRPRLVRYVVLLVIGSLVAIAWSTIDPGRLLEPLRSAVQAELVAALGAKVSFERLSIGLHGIVLQNLLVHAEVAAGAGLQTLSARRAYLRLDWRLLPQEPEKALEGVELDGVRAVVAVPASEYPGAGASSDAAERDGDAPTRVSQALRRLFATRLAWCRASDVSVSTPPGRDGKAARLFEGELECERKGGQLVVEMSAKVEVPHVADVWSVRARATADTDRLQLESLRLSAPGAVAVTRGTLQWAHAPISFALTGDTELRSATLADALHGLAAQVPELPAVRAERAVAAFELHGPVRDATRWRGRGRVSLAHPALEIPGARSELELDSLYFEAERHAAGFRFDSILADAPALQGRGQLDLPDAGPRTLSGSLASTDLEPLLGVLPEVASVQRLQPRLRAHGSAKLSFEAGWQGARAWADGELRSANLAVHHAAGVEEFVASRFATRFEYRSSQPTRLALSHILVQWPDGVLRGSGVLDDGAHHLELQLDRLDAGALTGALAGSLERGTLSGTLTVDGNAADPLEHVSAQLGAQDVLWRLPEPPPRPRAPGPLLAAVDLHRASASVTREPGGWRFDQVVLEGALELPSLGKQAAAWVEAKVRGRGAVTDRSHMVQLDVERLDGRILNLVIPGTVEEGVVSGSLAVSGTTDDPVQRLASRIQLSDGGWNPPRELSKLSRVGVGNASADLLYAAGQWELSNVRVDSTEGELRGNSLWSGGEHHTAATFVPAAHGFLATLVPGRLDGGAAQIEADVLGTEDSPLQEVRGVLRVGAGRWAPPAEAGLCTRSLEIQRASAAYSWSADGLRFDDIVLDTDAFSARGKAAWTAAGSWLDAQLTTQHAGHAFDAFPVLSGLVEQGEGSAHVRIETSAGDVSGFVEGRVSHGRLSLKSASAEHPTVHPVEAARFTYEFGPAQQRIRDLEIRGPELNVDLDAVWSDGGRVTGGGKLWLTSAYTSEVSQGADWALSLLGYPRIETDFTLSGTDAEVRMDAAIAHGWRWRILRVAVPERLERIGRAETPIYTDEGASTAGCID